MFAATASAINSDRTVTGVYKPRNPTASHYFRCVSAHWEDLEAAWDDYYQRQYGFSRSYIKEVMLRFLDCGDLHQGFARVCCHDCGPGSCMTESFWPSCQKYQEKVTRLTH